MQVFYSDTFSLPLPDGHRFPGGKYTALRDRLVATGLVREDELSVSPLATTDAILRAHDAAYVEAFETGQLDRAAIRRIGFPWSEGLVTRTRATVGGAIAAAEAALQDGIAGQLAGGTHHAHRDFGSGYCIYNDFAVTALHLLETGLASRIAIIDLDVHQGDGNAAILGDHPDVFVFSMHGEKNFPFRKQVSDLDVNLPDDTQDAAYLATLDTHLPAVLGFRPDFVLYQAGVDPLAEDKLGRLSLSHAGLMGRDRMVLDACRRQGIPVSMGIGGGYADPIEASVVAYANTYAVAQEVYGV
ncbi:histone deacetylase [uncultured Maricaulis sp.]|uniref:histone deacetylase family protein n=1 Tax=uncultured Maricaulis sp. TaxID=174710 RepID=UPI0030DD53C1